MKHDDFEMKCVYAGPGMMGNNADSPKPSDEPVKPTQSVYHCPKCGAPLHPDARFCDICGALSERYNAMNGALYAGPPIPPAPIESDHIPPGYCVYAGPPVPSSQDSENKERSKKSFFKKLYPWNHQKKK